ncbi:MAG: Lrp/AsnC family transcriptional regulator [Ferrimicrobium sp.]
MQTAQLDLLDRRIIQALYLDPRASFRRFAETLGVSEQTIARRYRSMVENQVLRVVAELNSQRISESDWAIRLRCLPGSAPKVATKVARDPDASWVQVVSGGTEVFAAIRSQRRIKGAHPLLQQFSGSSQIVDARAYCLLHEYSNDAFSPLGADWLTPQEINRLTQDPVAFTEVDRSLTVLHEADWPLIRALGKDGRATYRQLAEATHWHESTVRRRIEDLVGAGVLSFHVDLENDAIGVGAPALLWMSVSVPKLAWVGETLASHHAIPFVAATTGPTNLVAMVLCRDEAVLYRYLTKELADLEGVLHLEVAPIMHTVKHYSMITQIDANPPDASSHAAGPDEGLATSPGFDDEET